MSQKAFDKESARRAWEWLLAGSPFLVAVAGGLMFVFGAAYFDEGNKFGYVLTSLGTTTLAAGVFAAVAKSRFFLGVFGKVLSDIIYSDEFIEKRGDLGDIWERVTKALAFRSFPEVGDKVCSVLRRDLVNRDPDFYYSSIERHFWIVGLSDDCSGLKCRQKVILNIAPREGAKQITYQYRYQPSDGGRVKDTLFEIDGTSVLEDGDWQQGVQTVSRKLDPVPHEVVREQSIEIPFAGEFFMKSTLGETFCVKYRVFARSESSDFRLLFTPLGRKGLFSQFGPDNEGWIMMENNDLLLPGQGHILVPAFNNPKM